MQFCSSSEKGVLYRLFDVYAPIFVLYHPTIRNPTIQINPGHNICGSIKIVKLLCY